MELTIPLTIRVPLQPEEPPRNLPRLSFTARLLTPGPGIETTFQSVSLSKLLDQLKQYVSQCFYKQLQEQGYLPSNHVNVLEMLIMGTSL